MRPVIEKKKLQLRHIFYIFIIIICIISVGIAVYMQFFRDEKLGVIFGITDEQEDIEIKDLKENFLNIFTNDVNTIEEYTGDVSKIKNEDDIILLGYNIQKQTDNYMMDLKIPYFNINAEIPKQYNREIKEIFRDKSQSIESSTSKEYIIYNVKYKVYIDKDILSLVIMSELKEEDINEKIVIKTYNYNLRENREVKIDEILKQKNIDVNSANEDIKEEVNKAQEQNIRLKEAGYNVNVRDTNSDTYKIENAKEFFLGEKGYLYVVYPYGNDELTSEMDVMIYR